MTPSFLVTDAKREIMPSLLVPMVKREWEADRFFRRNKALPKMNAEEYFGMGFAVGKGGAGGS